MPSEVPNLAPERPGQKGQRRSLPVFWIYLAGLLLATVVLGCVWWWRYGRAGLDVITLALCVSMVTVLVNQLLGWMIGRSLETFLVHYLQMGARCGLFAGAIVLLRQLWPSFENLGLTSAIVLMFLATLVIETSVSVRIIQQEKR